MLSQQPFEAPTLFRRPTLPVAASQAVQEGEAKLAAKKAKPSTNIGEDSTTGDSGNMLTNSYPASGIPAKASSAVASTQLAAELGLKDYTPEFKKVDIALPGTCHWIRTKSYYQRWNSLRTDSVVFLRGESGTGKSVLSQFIASDMQDSNQSAIVVPFYCHSSIKELSSVSILQHILFHIRKEKPEVFASGVAKFNKFKRSISNNVTFEDLWSMFATLRREVSFTLVAVIDAINECEAFIRGQAKQPKGGEMWDFLNSLCQLSGGSQQGAATVKIFCTSQSGSTVDKVEAKFPRTVFDIEHADLRDGLDAFIEARFSSRLKDLSLEILSFLKQEIKTRAGSFKYQWIDAVVEELRKFHLSGKPLEFYQRQIDNLILDSKGSTSLIYRQSLLEIRKDLKAKSTIALALRIMFFTGTNLSIEQLTYAIACGRCVKEKPFRTPPSKALRRRLPKDLKSTLEASCGNLLAFDEDIVSLRHDSVREFLGQLDPDVWPDFSCESTENGMQLMASICLFFLNCWFILDITDSQIETHTTSTDMDNGLLRLAAPYWDYYVRSVTNISKLEPMLTQFLREGSVAYSQMLRARCYLSEPEVDEVDAQMVPISISLAEMGLLEVIKKGKFTRPGNIQLVNAWRRNMWERLVPSIVIDIHAKDYQGNTMMHKAAENGSIELLTWLIRKGARGDVYNEKGETPFFKAMTVEEDSCAWELIQKNLAVKETPSDKRISSIQFAAYHNSERVLAWLIDDGADVDDEEGLLGWTPLIIATQFDKTSIVKFLLTRHASPGKVTRTGACALRNAASKGAQNTIDMFFEAEPDLDPAPTNEDGYSPLYAAAAGGHVDTFIFLRQKQPYVAPLKENGWLPVHAAALEGHLEILRLLDPEELKSKTKFEQTPLLLAIIKGHSKVVKFCAEFNDVNGKSLDFNAEMHMWEQYHRSWTPLTSAVSSGHEEIVEFLLNEGAKDTINSIDANEWTLLHHAARSGKYELFVKLLALGLEPMTKDRFGNTPLHIAAGGGHLEIVQLLHDKWKDMPDYTIDARPESGRTPLQMAILGSSLPLIKLLLSPGFGADIEAIDGAGRTCLMYASYQKSAEVFIYVMGQVSPDDVNRRTWMGTTALQYAASRGNIFALEALLNTKADPNWADITGETPLLAAVLKFQQEAVEILLRKGAAISQLDHTGRTLLQHINKTSRLWSFFQDIMEYQDFVLPDDSKRLFNLLSIQAMFEVLERWPTPNIEVMRTFWGIVGHQIVSLHPWSDETDSEAKILFEGGMTRMVDHSVLMDSSCDKCETDRSFGPVYVCRSCFSLLLCDKCYKERMKGEVIEGCLPSHEYLTCADEKWWSLPYGSVNNAGDTMEAFVGKLESKYCSEPISGDFVLELEDRRKTEKGGTTKGAKKLTGGAA
jgi:ankyrin repeat protein